MVLGNQNKGEIRTFLIGKNGQITATQNTLEITQPTSVQFLK